VAAITIIFLRISLPNFGQFKAYQGKSGPRRYCITLLKGFWFSAYGCGVGTASTTNSVSETCVLAETEASNSRA